MTFSFSVSDISPDDSKRLLEKPFFHFGSGDPWAVEFPVWILRRDGLRVPPFSHHEAGDKSLQLLGMDAASWTRWLQRVISAHNPCLFGEIREPEIQDLPSEDLIKRSWRFYFWELARREKAMAQLDDPSLAGASPMLIWDGNRAIKDKLIELWGQYTLSRNDYALQGTSDAVDIDPKALLEAIGTLNDEFTLDVVQMFNVPYPETVHMIVGSSILVIGMNNSTTTEEFIFHIREGAKQLSQAK
jgi:hypothetical protein